MLGDSMLNCTSLVLGTSLDTNVTVPYKGGPSLQLSSLGTATALAP